MDKRLEQIKKQKRDHFIKIFAVKSGYTKEYLHSLSNNELLSKVCDYEELIHYASTIRDWVENIYGVELR